MPGGRRPGWRSSGVARAAMLVGLAAATVIIGVMAARQVSTDHPEVVAGSTVGSGSVPARPEPADCPLTAAGEGCWRRATGVAGWDGADIVAGRSPLRRHVGVLVVDVDGAVIEDVWVEGCISVRASQVRIRNVLVRSSSGCGGGRHVSGNALIATGVNGGGGIEGLVVEDAELDGTGAPGDTMGIGQTEFTCRRCHIHGVAKGAKADQDVTMEDSYIHDLAFDGATHTEGFFFDGGAGGITVRHCWMRANEELSTAALSLNNDWPGSKVLVEGNYLEGVGGAGITGGALNREVPAMDHVVVVDNALSPNNGWGGRSYAYGFDVTRPGNLWVGNHDAESGAVVPAPEPA